MTIQGGDGSRKKPKARKPIPARQFAINQLKKAGIKPGANPEAQFRAANAKAKKRRVAGGLGRASTVHASSALAAGNRTTNKRVLKARSVRGAGQYRPGTGR